MKKIFLNVMTVRRKITLMAILSIMVVCIVSCDDFVGVDHPDSQLTGNVVFSDKATANAALSNVYSKMRDSGILTGQAMGLSCRLGLYTDELDFYQDIGANSFYTNSISAEDGPVKDIWNSAFNIIYGANALIEGVAPSTLSQQDKDNFTGEALFIRALIHLYLTGLYGDIPYVTTTDYDLNSRVQKLSQSAVYNTIISDLEQAMQLLPVEDSSVERVRPNKAVAAAALARAYLYDGQYDKAEEMASLLINDASFQLNSDLNSSFLKDSPSTIWQFSPAVEGSNTQEGALFIFLQGPPPVVALTENLVNSFAQGDLRRQYWIKEVTNGTYTWYHSYKYKMRPVVGSSTEYSIVFRMAEMYLIRAESRARLGQLGTAASDLNSIRANAGLPPTQANSQQDLLTAILQERQWELFTEFGHRFFDLKRFGVIDTILPVTKSGWDPSDKLLPIPAQELLANPNLNPQNQGY